MPQRAFVVGSGATVFAACVLVLAAASAAGECPPPPLLLVDPATTNEDGLGDSVALRFGQDAFALLGNPIDDFVGTNSGSVGMLRPGAEGWIVVDTFAAPATDADDRFGSALSFRGETLVVGAPMRTVGSLFSAGSASVFRYEPGSDALDWVHETELLAPQPEAIEQFGNAVATDGVDTIVVGRSGRQEVGGGPRSVGRRALQVTTTRRCFMKCTALLARGAVSLIGTDTRASFVLHESYSLWGSSAGDFETITFNEIPLYSLVTDQYADIGLVFVDLDGNWTDGTSLVVYPQDGFGLDGEEVIDIHLTQDAFAIGAHFPGILRYRLFLGDALVYDSDLIGPQPYDNFGGVVSSSVLFDRVLLTGQPFNDQVFLDNLYISFAPVPAPAGAALFAIAPAALGSRRRRRVR